MTISREDFWSFITELVTRNPTVGIPALEDGLFANLLIFRLLILYICVWKGKGKGKMKGKRKGKREGKEKRRGNYEDSEGTLMRSRVYSYTRLHCRGSQHTTQATTISNTFWSCCYFRLVSCLPTCCEWGGEWGGSEEAVRRRVVGHHQLLPNWAYQIPVKMWDNDCRLFFGKWSSGSEPGCWLPNRL